MSRAFGYVFSLLYFFDYTNTYLQQVDNHHNDDYMALQLRSTVSMTRTRDSEGERRSPVRSSFLFCFNSTNVLLINRLHKYHRGV